MITVFLLLAFAAVLVFMVGWGFSKPERVYQYPFLAGITWTGFLLPQAIGVVRNPEAIPKAVLADGGLEMALLMCLLCAGMGLLGYMRTPPKRWLMSRRAVDYDTGRLFLGGLLLLGLSFYGLSGMASLSGGYYEYYSVEGHYELNWRGKTVMYSFFKSMAYPAFLLCLLNALNKPAWWKWVVVAAAAVIPLGDIVLFGRRGMAVEFFLICGATLFFALRWVPPRMLLFPALVLAAIGIVVAPEYRAHSQLGGDWSEIGKIDAAQSFGNVLRGKGNEFASGVVLISAYHRGGEIRCGRGFYNNVISSLVPRFVVGNRFKRDLYWRVKQNQDSLTMRYYGWKRKFYMGVTGPCDAFREFWFFGSFLYFILGFGFRIIWEYAAKAKNVGWQVLYVSFLPLALVTVSDTVTLVLSKVIITCGFLGPILWAAKTARMTRRAPGRQPNAARFVRIG